MKLIFSDIDGTLINNKHQVTPATKEAIQHRIALGDMFIPVSARMPQAIETVGNEITTNYPMICYNGALIIDKDDQTIASQPMEIAEAESIIKLVSEEYPDVAWNVYAAREWLSPRMPANLNEERIVQVESTRATLEDVANLPSCHKTLLIGQPQEITELQKKLQQEFTDLNIVKSSPILLEIMAKGIQKGQAVKQLINFYKVPIADTWAFGDNYNDEEMLKAVGHSVVMGNAPADLKQNADEVTLDNNHDGIAAALNKML